MSVPSQILMNLLSSGVRAVSGATAPAPAAESSTDFASMLTKARAGELSSGLPVTIARGADIELSDDQLARLAQAADRAQSAGATRALALIDGRALEIDTTTRQVVREHSLADARVITGINGVIDLGGHPGTRAAEDDLAEQSALTAASRLDRQRTNRSLLEALSQR